MVLRVVLAQHAHQAGNPAQAMAFLAMAEQGPLPPLELALVHLARAHIAFFSTHARDAAAWFAGAVALACLALVWAAYPTVSEGGVVRAAFRWMPSVGLDLVLRMDGLAWLFAGLVTGIGALVVLPDSGVPEDVDRVVMLHTWPGTGDVALADGTGSTSAPARTAVATIASGSR